MQGKHIRNSFEKDLIESVYEKKHVLLLYDELSYYRKAAKAFLADGLKSGDLCVLAYDEYLPHMLEDDLEEYGISFDEVLESGQLFVLDVKQHYSSDTGFDPDRTLKSWQELTQQSLKSGRPRVRAVGEASFALDDELLVPKLIYYENIINRDLFPAYPFLSLCVYNKTRYSVETIKSVVQAHPMFVYNSNVYKHNIYYISPDIYFRKDAGRSEVDQWLDNVKTGNLIVKKIDASEKKFRLLYENAPIPYLSLDKSGCFLDVNRRLCNVLGYNEAELLGKSFSFVLHPDWQEAFKENFKNFKRSGKASDVEFCMRKKDGSYILAEFNGVIGYNDDSSFRQTHCVFHDVTKEKKATRALLKAKNEAEEASNAKTVFLANMSHEIRTPLNGVMGMLQLLKQTSLNDEQTDFLDTGLESCSRLSHLLGNILDVSRIEAGKLEIVNDDFDLYDIMQSLRQLFGASVSQKGLSLNLNIDPAVPKSLVGDKFRLHQILDNLVGNALKFSATGEINVSATSLTPLEEGKWRILFSVSDTGMGIADEKLSIIFDDFIQADSGPTRNFEGAGLGLTVFKKLISLMGGRAAIESKVGRGTTVYFCLDFAVAEESRQDRECDRQRCKDRIQNILVVEDEWINRYSLVRILQNNGFSVQSADNGQQALEVLANKQFDVILMDIQMPEMDGIEATRAIRNAEVGEVNSRIPVIALTAYAAAGDERTFLDAGMDDYMSKPLDINLLLKKINAYESV